MVISADTCGKVLSAGYPNESRPVYFIQQVTESKLTEDQKDQTLNLIERSFQIHQELELCRKKENRLRAELSMVEGSILKMGNDVYPHC